MGLLKSTSTHDLAQYTAVKGPVTITVGPGVRAMQVRGCQPWVRLGDTLDDAIVADGASSVLPSAGGLASGPITRPAPAETTARLEETSVRAGSR